jgi:hypothetical protein
MKQMSRFLWLLLVLFGLTSHAAHAADCVLSIDPSSGSEFDLSEAYVNSLNQSNATAGASQKKDIKINNAGEKSCQFFLTITPQDLDKKLSLKAENENNVSKKDIEYSIKYNEREILGGVEGSDQPTATTHTQVISGTVDPGDQQTIPLEMTLKTNDFMASGTYSTQFECKLYEGEFASPKKLESKVYDGTLTIADVMRISLTAQNEPANNVGEATRPEFEVDLGDLNRGQEGKMALHIKTNNGYKVTFASENGGKLVNKAITDQTIDRAMKEIDYTMKVNNEQISFAVPDPAGQDAENVHLSQSAGTVISFGEDNSKHTISFKVTNPDDAKKKLAGDYEDVVTVTAKTQR